MNKLLFVFMAIITLFLITNLSTAEVLTSQKILSKINSIKEKINPNLLQFYNKFEDMIKNVLNSNIKIINDKIYQLQEGNYVYRLRIMDLIKEGDDISVSGSFDIYWRGFHLPMYIVFDTVVFDSKDLRIHYEFFTYNYTIEYPDNIIGKDEAYQIAMDYVTRQNSSLANDMPKIRMFFVLLTPENEIIMSIRPTIRSFLNETWELSHDPSDGVWIPVYEFYYTSMNVNYEWYVLVSASNGTVIDFVHHTIKTYCDAGCQNGNSGSDNGSILFLATITILAIVAPIVLYRFIRRKS